MVAVPVRAVAHGLERNRLPLISRWKILDNLRRSLMAPAMLLLLVSGWTVLPGDPLVWTVAVLAVLLFPLSPRARRFAGPRLQQSWRVFLRTAIADIESAIAQAHCS